MPCPTCNHTMECVAIGDERATGRVYLCPRCGTAEADDNVYVPKLVERCREFNSFACLVANPSEERNAVKALSAEWRRLGIPESIRKPA